METNEKLMTLLRLMDEPEATTEAQLQELLSDEEVRTAYNLMADCKKVYQREKHASTLPCRHGQAVQRHGWIYRIAAVFLGVVFLSGLVFATIGLLTPASAPEDSAMEAMATDEALTGADGLPSVRFDDVRLDSILTIVSAHYGKAVRFRNDEAKGMKFIMTWEPDMPLTDFIDGLNLFDGLSLTLLRDTIFVETVEENI